MGSLEEKGKMFVIAVVLLILGRDLMNLVLFKDMFGGNIGSLVGVCITLLLCLFTYKGRSWARWILVVLCSISFLSGILSVIQYFLLNFTMGFTIFDILFSMGINIFAIVCLTMIPSVSDYFEACNSNW